MLKCINTQTSEFIIIIDPQWKGRILELRALDSQNRLVCPGCHQPVRTRAGKVKCWHFAHKHLQNCPFQYESIQLLQTRAALYEWLLEHYSAAQITVEKLIPDLGFPRHVDCWVDLEQGSILYWILDTRRPPEERNSLREALRNSGAHTHTLFTSSMLHLDEHESQHLFLTTTEREFMEQSSFDELVKGYAYSPGKTLHYLNIDDKTLITYRNLHMIHSPQKFSGYRIVTPLSKVVPSLESGEFVLPGEADRLVRLQSESHQLLEKQQRTLPRLFKKTNPSPIDIGSSREPPPTTPTPSLKDEYNPFSKIAVCKVCGTRTSDWITYEGKTGTCLCRNCYNKGNR